MLVGSNQQGNFRQRRFGQNQAVVELVFGNQALPEQAANELLANGFRRRIQVKGADAPLLQVGQCCPRQFPVRFTVAVSENDVQFVNRRGRQDQCVTLALENLAEIVGGFFVSGEIEDDVSVEREL